MNELTTMEAATLLSCEATIERGLRTFADVGKALATIRFQKLYRATHTTFDEYCRDRWYMESSRARQLIAAAEVVDDLRSVTTVTLLPKNESQARPLVRLAPPQRVAAWSEATVAGTPTRARVEDAAKRVTMIPEQEIKSLDACSITPRMLAARHRILSEALKQLEPDIQRRVNPGLLASFCDDEIEDAAITLLEGQSLHRLVTKVISSQ